MSYNQLMLSYISIKVLDYLNLKYINNQYEEKNKIYLEYQN